jgi:hypothetical protein
MKARRLRLFLGAAVLLVLLPVAAPARDLVPANDDFGHATPMDILPYHSEHDMLLASAETGEPICAGVGPARTIWYSFTPLTDIDLRFELYPSAAIAIYTGSSVGALNEVSCDRYEATLSAEGGRTYYIQLGVDALQLTDLPDDHVTLDVTARGRIQGRVTGPLGQALTGVCVAVYEGDVYGYGYSARETSTLPDGSYLLAGLLPGTYAVDFGCGGGRWTREWYDDQPTAALSDRINLTAGATIGGVNASLAPGSFISGKILADGGAIAAGTCVAAYDAPDHVVSYVESAIDGTYAMNVPPGSYRVFFGCGQSRYLPSWYDGKSSYATATPLTVSSGGETGSINATLTPKPRPANDFPENAEEITALPYTDTAYTDQLYYDFEPDSCDGYIGAALWYSFTPAQDMLLVAAAEIDEFNSPPELVVYAGSVSASRRVACTDAKHDRAVFRATAGTTYLIEVLTEAFPSPFDSGSQMKFRIDQALAATAHDFGPSVPCAVACSYWLASNLGEDQNEAACAATPGGIPGSWQDVAVTVPATVDGSVPVELAYWMRPALDSDVYLCRATPDAKGHRFVALGAYGVSECQAEAAWCTDTFAAPVAPGESYVIRVYNWSDVPTVNGTYGFIVDR